MLSIRQPSIHPAAFVLALAALACAPAALAAPQSSNAGSLAGYEIIRLGRGHFNRMDFVATIDGVEGLMIVDTGAANTVLNAGKYGLLLKNGAKRPANLPASTHVNEMSAPIGIGMDVRFGSVHLGNVPFPLVPARYLYDRLYRGANDQQYDGFLGENILRHYNAVVDCGRLALYLNTDPRRKLDLSRALTQNGWTRIPMTNAGLNFTVPCTLGGHPYRLLVDTGSPYTVFDTSTLYKEHIRQDEVPIRGAVIGYNPKGELLVHADGLQIGSYVATNVHPLSDPEIIRALEKSKAPAGAPPLAGLLGGDALGSNNAMIDIGGYNLYLKQPGAAAAAAALQ
jgi:hypothetical protein